jgi:hypothetical protein
MELFYFLLNGIEVQYCFVVTQTEGVDSGTVVLIFCNIHSAGLILDRLRTLISYCQPSACVRNKVSVSAGKVCLDRIRNSNNSQI